MSLACFCITIAKRKRKKKTKEYFGQSTGFLIVCFTIEETPTFTFPQKKKKRGATSISVDLLALLFSQQIWTEIGESEAEKDRMLLELERECLEVYRRKVEDAANSKARLHQSVAAKEAELATLMAALGELSIHSPVKISLN